MYYTISVHSGMPPVHSISMTLELLQWIHDCASFNVIVMLFGWMLLFEPFILRLSGHAPIPLCCRFLEMAGAMLPFFFLSNFANPTR